VDDKVPDCGIAPCPDLVALCHETGVVDWVYGVLFEKLIESGRVGYGVGRIGALLMVGAGWRSIVRRDSEPFS
jgi:hypothetical protein